MTPAARAAAAIQILDAILQGEPSEAQLTRWARASRFAGSGDRAAVRDIVYDTLRRRRSRAALGGADSGRGLVLGALRETGTNPDTIFTGEGHAPAPLTVAERAGGRAPTEAEVTDLPDWIAETMKADLGSGFVPVAAALRDRAPVWLRANLARTTAAEARQALAADGIAAEPDPRCGTALRATEGERRIQGSAAYREGLVELQDLSPQMACAALPIAPGTTALDFCAGGGGKALALAARGARVTAWDAALGRMRDLPARAARAGVRVRIAEVPDGLHDLVLTDVPCSGSGTWRRTPEAKWRLTPADLDRLAETQAAILDRAARHVRPGGMLAYMTCSLFARENEDQVARFLETHPDFTLRRAATLTPISASDGFFHALLVC
ncbi:MULTISPECIES: RsmB/NOP family class I SAM-dependent RNA methyltransferase [unclassified Paracoccus (in: a-proteobacteria)]|uniref:RsmB/NOP family class I SAM-dependent RNA methyltransferase n=1 Tax=unclassified Paracoccus (in: a-proteobacteria) TaxID=2688777 RepID=UPI00160416F6|nr:MULTISPECIES: RsmB/NOP family class I SAM-dependent RNA methyltransferase [unclassified Paracoccus (in: a-proteobacteria)]MBB1490335.1 RsmB/NOP family class I SAM-dependent RNA methyltransferase [Paracoccus sp. MC1854]MBB1497177.1 RsmB/NOP family class I SAM-dependent RNA methyltransferase [Paracoccus sp. MC1862]QQO46531.1 RsmB/NOP family class I SAM-dependent RNA methyltransferase [Paracoccus sp. MC1862]